MSCPAHLRLSWALSSFLPLTACLFCAAACNNTCFSVSLNSPGSNITVKVADPPPSCTLTTANGIVHLEIGAASGSAPTPGTIGQRIVHLYVTLAGADVHSSAFAIDDTPGWQPLVPAPGHPLQVDLLADPQASRSSARFADFALPAGVYRQIRLRLASPLPNQPGLADYLLEANPCGVGMPHCAVLSDGRVWPLTFSPAAQNLRVLSEGLPSHDLYVPPDGAVTFTIELDPDRSFLWPFGDSLLLSPVLHLRVNQTPPPTD